MTTINQTTMLLAAITALVSSVTELKKAGHETIGLGTEIIDGVKYRDLKNWLKDFKAKQKDVTPAPAAKVAESKPAAKAPVSAKADAHVFTNVELKGADLLIGRTKDVIQRVVKSADGERTAIAASGLRIPVEMIERNNRGNLRTVAAFDPKSTAPAKAAPKATAAKAPTESNVAGVRDLELSPSTTIESAVYDRARKVLRVEFKNGAVYEYANVGIREANAFEKAESAGKFLAANIKGHKDVTKIKSGADAKPAESKPAAKVAAKVDAVEYKSSELRGATLLNGRKAEIIEKVVASKDGEGRDVITDAKSRFNVSSLRKNNRGKFVVEVADAPAAKTAASAPAAKNRRANFDAEAANNTRKSKPVPALPKVSDVKGAEVRIVKGAKDKMVKVIRVVSREGQRVAITEGRAALPFGLIVFNDDVLTYTGKLTAEEFRAA